MKITRHRRKDAFTLIEIVTVMTIIALLATLVVGSYSYIKERQAASQAKVQIALLSKALEEYKNDIGYYPLTNNTTTGAGNSAILYQALFYEGYLYTKDATPPSGEWVKTVGPNTKFPKATKIYLADLDPSASKQGWVNKATIVPPSTTILDPWKKEYAYRSALDESITATDATVNPDFDLWSMGKDGKTNPGTPSDKLNLDDIDNF